MIYSNETLVAKERELDFGTIYQVSMGEKGRGRHLMALTCPEGITMIQGENPELTISLTKSGKPRISKGTDRDCIYLMLSAKGGYTRRGNGTIHVLKKQKQNFKVIACGNGADGAAGRIGFWECALLKAPITDTIIRVRTSGAGYGTPSDLYVIHGGHVYQTIPESLHECCETLGIELPCSIKDDGRSLDNEEWDRI